MTVVNCYYCQCPVNFDPTGKLAEHGVTLETCTQHDLAVICNLCMDMAEVEGSEVCVMDQSQLKDYLDKDAA